MYKLIGLVVNSNEDFQVSGAIIGDDESPRFKSIVVAESDIKNKLKELRIIKGLALTKEGKFDLNNIKEPDLTLLFESDGVPYSAMMSYMIVKSRMVKDGKTIGYDVELQMLDRRTHMIAVFLPQVSVNGFKRLKKLLHGASYKKKGFTTVEYTNYKQVPTIDVDLHFKEG